MQELIGFYEEKYPDATIFTTLKSLTYFDDAEDDPMPVMISGIDWESVKKHIVNTVAKSVTAK